METDITVRLEEPRDYQSITYVTKAAFSYPERIKQSQIGCCLEHYMVHQLRQRDGIPELSFVAERNNELVGHIIYSKAYVEQPNGTRLDVLNFGPLSVLPAHQKTGVGSALMRHSIAEAKDLRHGAILFFGHHTYYPRFGFTEAAAFGITTADGENFPAFMAMELQEGYLQNATGRFIESDIYDDNLNRTAAKAYDEQLSKELTS